MSPQEAELLKYLEDLQQNNPAEYEMLVKDLQEKEAEKRGGKLPPSQQQGEQVTPTPGFVAKTRSATRQGAKVFVNVCSSDHVDAPAPVDVDFREEAVEVHAVHAQRPEELLDDATTSWGTLRRASSSRKASRKLQEVQQLSVLVGRTLGMLTPTQFELEPHPLGCHAL